MQEDIIHIGYRLRAARALRELSLSQLAEMVGVHRSTLSRYECGLVSRPSMPTLLACADKLAVSVPWLYGALSRSATGDVEEDAWLEIACLRLAESRVVKYVRVSV